MPEPRLPVQVLAKCKYYCKNCSFVGVANPRILPSKGTEFVNKWMDTVKRGDLEGWVPMSHPDAVHSRSSIRPRSVIPHVRELLAKP